MRFGAYTACLHDKTLDEALATLRGLGLDSVEVNAGGFIPAPHIHVDALLAGARARREYLARIADHGIALTGLNVNGNPLHPDLAVSSKHASDLHKTIELAGLLGVRNVVTMSGQPGAHPGGLAPAWVVEPWHSAASEVLEYQWTEVVVPFWRDIEQRARRADVRVCIEMHPHNVVYNPATLTRLIERVGATNVGAEMDPSHLFWQGIEPVVAIEYLGDRVFHAAAKDVRINEEHCRLNGVLDDRFRAPDPGSATGLGGRYVANLFPEQAPWEFVSVGRGHDVAYWADFLAALAKADPDIAVNIEHEDVELGQLEGLTVAAETLLAARKRILSAA
ncbi:sugar phosphate isomerase/epimerase [Amycolatopsis sp. K13G38]|uniref:Sugar phosphate isomerase/epimerase n=1 Tax=Amycolatopsis acididurans TaxID=2724524 RepID=A0ABX1J1I8_9PSEU|nr:sugar phosphate isomerase/epimerase [Amycolatopsis acididurans]NKQ53633.1 sugar phosphate isomerase/epimerase [Amycolatopsis acididurans]